MIEAISGQFPQNLRKISTCMCSHSSVGVGGRQEADGDLSQVRVDTLKQVVKVGFTTCKRYRHIQGEKRWVHVHRHVYSKTVLGCKENRRYEIGVQKIVFRGRRLRKRIF